MKNEIRQFYTRLMGTPTIGLIDIDPCVDQTGPVLSFHAASSLIAPIGIDEIHSALFGMDGSRIAGVDGFNVAFFQNA